MAFANSFLVGASTAAHQAEGNNIHSDYWTMEHMEYSSDAAEDAGPQKAAAGIDGRNKTDDAWQKMLSDQSSAFMPYRPISPPGSR